MGDPVPTGPDRSVHEIRTSPRTLADLGGIFTIIEIDASGSGVIAPDHCGYVPAYRARNDQAEIVGSTSALVAVANGGPRPAKSVTAPCSLAVTGWLIGAHTGFEDVGCLPANQMLKIDRGRIEVQQRIDAPPWIPTPEAESPSIEEAAAAIADGVSYASRLTATTRYIDLTAGLDSRLVTAAALHLGVTDQFTFLTIGGEGLHDVQVARDLARTFGLDHHVGFAAPVTTRSLPDRIRDHVQATAGISNCIDLRSAEQLPEGVEQIRVQGLLGEALRAYYPGWPDKATGARFWPAFDRRLKLDPLGLAEPDFVEHCRQSAHTAAAPDWLPPDLGGPDQAHNYYLTVRLRDRVRDVTRMAPDRRIYPIFTPPAIAYAAGGGAQARAADLPHRQLLQALSPELADYHYDDTTTAAPAHQPKPATLMQSIREQSIDETGDFYREVVADHSNPAWDRLQRDRCVAAVERLSSLDQAERRALDGAVTAAVWLSD
ncbi:MAG: hypothetical protein ACR2QE_13525 [Acidimicrobiales bacterium]